MAVNVSEFFREGTAEIIAGSTIFLGGLALEAFISGGAVAGLVVGTAIFVDGLRRNPIHTRSARMTKSAHPLHINM